MLYSLERIVKRVAYTSQILQVMQSSSGDIFDLSMIEAMGLEQSFRVPPSGKSSEGRNLEARDKMRVAMPALSRQLFLCLTRFFSQGCPLLISRTVCTRIPGFCARIAQICLKLLRG